VSVECDPLGVDPPLHRGPGAGNAARVQALHHELVEPIACIGGAGDESKGLPGGLYQSLDFTCPLDLMRMSMSARS
jgi:hypothetical protein